MCSNNHLPCDAAAGAFGDPIRGVLPCSLGIVLIFVSVMFIYIVGQSEYATYSWRSHRKKEPLKITIFISAMFWRRLSVMNTSMLKDFQDMN